MPELHFETPKQHTSLHAKLALIFFRTIPKFHSKQTQSKCQKIQKPYLILSLSRKSKHNIIKKKNLAFQIRSKQPRDNPSSHNPQFHTTTTKKSSIKTKNTNTVSKSHRSFPKPKNQRDY